MDVGFWHEQAFAAMRILLPASNMFKRRRQVFLRQGPRRSSPNWAKWNIGRCGGGRPSLQRVSFLRFEWSQNNPVTRVLPICSREAVTDCFRFRLPENRSNCIGTLASIAFVKIYFRFLCHDRTFTPYQLWTWVDRVPSPRSAQPVACSQLFDGALISQVQR